MLSVFGSIASDTIRTPKRTLENVLGGAATFAAISASNFVDTGLIAVVGDDLPEKYHKILSERLDLQGLTIKKGKTFHYDGKYDEALGVRTTLSTELNVLTDFRPSIPNDYRKSEFVYLANNDPEQNVLVLEQFDKIKFSMCDTIDFWISTKRDAVIKMIQSVDGVVINDEEARLLTKEFNLIKCAKKMMEWGVKYIIIKKGEHGSLMFYQDTIFPMPGFPLVDVLDPTGAGDSFAGAMIGYLAGKNTTSFSDIKKAITYGNVMGSFAVGGYGLDGLLGIKDGDIENRCKIYEDMIRF